MICDSSCWWIIIVFYRVHKSSIFRPHRPPVTLPICFKNGVPKQSHVSQGVAGPLRGTAQRAASIPAFAYQTLQVRKGIFCGIACKPVFISALAYQTLQVRMGIFCGIAYARAFMSTLVYQTLR